MNRLQIAISVGILSSLSLLAGATSKSAVDDLSDLEIMAKEELNLLLRKEGQFAAARIDNVLIDDSIDGLEVLFQCVADQSIKKDSLEDFIANSVRTKTPVLKLEQAKLTVRVTPLPFSTIISDAIQRTLLTDQNIVKHGQFRLAGIAFGQDNGITINLQSAALSRAHVLSEEVVSGFTVRLESEIFSNEKVKTYGGEDRFFNTSVNYTATDKISAVVRKLFHSTMLPNAMQVQAIEPMENRGIRVSVSQSGDLAEESLKVRLAEVLQNDAGFTSSTALASELIVTKNSVLSLQEQLRNTVHKLEESYVGSLYFDNSGNLVAPIFGSAELSQNKLVDVFNKLINAKETQNLAPATQGSVNLTSLKGNIKSSLNEFIRSEEFVGANITKVSYGRDLSLNLEGYCDGSKDLDSIRAYIQKLSTEERFSKNFPGQIEFEQIKLLPIRSMPAYLNQINDINWYLKHVEITGVRQANLTSSLIFDVKYHAPFEPAFVAKEIWTSLSVIPEYKSRLKLPIILGNQVDDSRQLVDEDAIKEEIKNISGKLRTFARVKRGGKQLNEGKLLETRQLIDKRLQTNPARSSFWFLKAYCEYLNDDTNQRLTNHLLYNVVEIETRYPGVKSNRGIAMGRLGAPDDFMNKLKEVRSKTIMDLRNETYLNTYKNL